MTEHLKYARPWTIHDDVNPFRFVIPGLTRNPEPFWIPAFAGMTGVVVINDVVYINEFGDDPDLMGS